MPEDEVLGYRPGYYWAKHNGIYEIVELTGSGFVYCIGKRYRRTFSDFKDWVGPLESPKERPKKMVVIYTKEELEEAKKVLEYDNSDSLPSWGWARAAQILATELTKDEREIDWDGDEFRCQICGRRGGH